MSSTRTPARPLVSPRKHERRHRVRPGRQRPRRRLLRRLPRLPRPSGWVTLGALAGVLVVVAALVWLLLFSPVLAVGAVEVTGSQGDNAAAVRQIAAIPAGLPLARVDTDAVGERLRLLPHVESVSVQRSWPSTVRIDVVEREPVAVVDVDGAQWLIDRRGVLFAQVTEVPAGVPLLEVEGADERTTRAALEVIAAVPADVSSRLARVSAQSPDSVVLHLAGGRTVIWGSAEDSERKALVLTGVFDQPGGTIDLSSPSTVVLR